jgi:glycosyltransferase involved in cell wall biosynthesis
MVAPAAEHLPASFAGLRVQGTGRFRGHPWEQIELPKSARDSFLVNLCSTGPMFRENQMIVLHDAAVAALPENFTLAFRAWYRIMIAGYARMARKVATVSSFSADELVRHFGIDRRKIDVIPESGEHILRDAADYSLHEKFGLENDRYFLAVGSLASNKNFNGIVEAVARLPANNFKFVIVGGRNSKIFSTVRAKLDGAKEVGYATDAQLRALYERAACFVYPSTYEGFGLPPLEAMSCGCPVLVANSSALPETCGDGAAYCDPYDPDDIARKLGALLSSPEARDELRSAGLAHAKRWTWQNAARRLQVLVS